MPASDRPRLEDLPSDTVAEIHMTLRRLVAEVATAVDPDLDPARVRAGATDPAETQRLALASLSATELVRDVLNLAALTSAHEAAHGPARLTYADLGRAVGITRQSARTRWPWVIPDARPGRPAADRTTAQLLVPDLGGDLSWATQCLSVWASTMMVADVGDLLGIDVGDLFMALEELHELAYARDHGPTAPASPAVLDTAGQELPGLHPARIQSQHVEAVREAAAALAALDSDVHQDLTDALTAAATAYRRSTANAATTGRTMLQDPARAMDAVLTALGANGHDPERDRLARALEALPTQAVDGRMARTVPEDLLEQYQAVHTRIRDDWYRAVADDVPTA